MSSNQLSEDQDFCEQWPLVWNRLKPFFLKMQQDHVKANPGKHEENGRFVGFVAEVMETLDHIDSTIDTGTVKRKVFKPLHR